MQDKNINNTKNNKSINQSIDQSITLPHKFSQRDYQLDVFKAIDSEIKRIFLRWNRRAGKDKTCFNIVAKKAFERVGAYYYLFPTYSQGRKALWEQSDKDGFRLIDHIPECLRKINNNEMKITLLNGSVIRVIGTEDIDSLRGTNPIGVVVSEWAEHNPAIWGEILEPILMQNDGWIIFNGTPKGKNHMYNMEVAHLNDPKWHISEIQSLWPDLPNYYQTVTIEQIDEVRKGGKSEEYIEQEYGVSYIAGSKGNYYSDQIKKCRQSGRINKFPYDQYAYVDTFWDIGFSDDTAIWFKQVIGRSHVFIDYLEGNTKDLLYYVQQLRDKGYVYRTHYLPHDGAQGKFQLGFSHKDALINLCHQAGIGSDVVIAPKPRTKQEAIDAVRARFSLYSFDESRCGDALVKLSLYHRKWDARNQVFLEHPVHDWTSHAADALTTEALTCNMQYSPIDANYNKENKIQFDPFD